MYSNDRAPDSESEDVAPDRAMLIRMLKGFTSSVFDPHPGDKYCS